MWFGYKKCLGIQTIAQGVDSPENETGTCQWTTSPQGQADVKSPQRSLARSGPRRFMVPPVAAACCKN